MHTFYRQENEGFKEGRLLRAIQLLSGKAGLQIRCNSIHSALSTVPCSLLSPKYLSKILSSFHTPIGVAVDDELVLEAF